MLILWSDQYEIDRKQASSVINSLILITADKRSTIFYINIEIVAMLVRKWQRVLCFDKTILTKMLRAPDEKEGSHLWKMTAIQMIALACTFEVPVSSPEEDVTALKFQLNEKYDDLFVSLLKLQELKKK